VLGEISELLLQEEARLAGGGRHERRSVAGLGFCGARNDSRSRDKCLLINRLNQTRIDGRRGRLIYRREVRSSEKMGIGKGASGVGVGATPNCIQICHFHQSIYKQGTNNEHGRFRITLESCFDF